MYFCCMHRRGKILQINIICNITVHFVMVNVGNLVNITTFEGEGILGREK